MSVPVTTRLDEKTVEALDEAVAAGLAGTRGAIVSEAVRGWLADHGEATIAASYQRRYGVADPAQDDLVANIGAFSAAACLAANQRR